MNILSAILDAMISFIRNNPLTVVIIVMLAVFVPSLFGAVLIGLLVVLLLIVAWPVAMLLRLRREARRMERDGSAAISAANTAPAANTPPAAAETATPTRAKSRYMPPRYARSVSDRMSATTSSSRR